MTGSPMGIDIIKNDRIRIKKESSESTTGKVFKMMRKVSNDDVEYNVINCY